MKSNFLCSELAKDIAPLLLHPGIQIRFEAVAFVSAMARFLSVAESHCLLLPILQPMLRYGLVDVCSQPVLLEALRPYVPRVIFTKVLTGVRRDMLELKFPVIGRKKCMRWLTRCYWLAVQLTTSTRSRSG